MFRDRIKTQEDRRNKIIRMMTKIDDEIARVKKEKEQERLKNENNLRLKYSQIEQLLDTERQQLKIDLASIILN